MADSPESSPAPSSLDFAASGESEDEYIPVRRARQAPKRGTGAGAGARGGGAAPKKGPTINLGALKRAQALAAVHPVEGDVEDDEVLEGGEFMGQGKRIAIDLSDLDLKPDHAARPLWVDESGHIILEAFAAFAQQAQEFLIAIAEPVSRPSFIHEYKITKPSLHAAMSVGLETKDIIEVLSRLSKIPLPTRLVERIADWTSSYGKIRLVLKHNRYFLESTVPEFLHRLLTDPEIGPCRIVRDNEEELQRGIVPRRDFAIAGTEEARKEAEREAQRIANGDANGNANGAPSRQNGRSHGRDDDMGAVIGIDQIDEMDEDDTVHSFEVSGEKMENVRRRCKDIDLPALEEYDFRNDTRNANLDIQLKPMTVIRPYQETSLAKMFGNGRARSGIIVLPCGAGKTLVGITAACTIKKSALVLCTSAVSVAQWKQQFLYFSNISERQICTFTQGDKEPFKTPSGIVISTYSMIAKTGHRAHDAAKFMQWLTSREWGFLLLDEVHVVPADMFRKCVNGFKVHAKLGLTATLVREDDKISDLGYLIGPKLYEANWMDLAKNGHIATVQCAEVWCPMTPEFYSEYLQTKSRKRILLHALNPNKFQACQFLIHYHESRGDKVIVFSDNVFALEAYAKKLGKSYIHGGTPEGERLRILSRFQHDPNLNTIFLSKVGDTSIDLPEATCLIQISSHFGSRRQEAQRLGRILRAKRRNDEGFNAFFYSLVSKDTQEMWYSSKRQGFLIDQGYAFKVITELHGIEDLENLVFPTRDQQIALLEEVLNASGEMEETADHYSRLSGGKHQHRKPTAPNPGTGGRGGGAGGSGLDAMRFTSRLEELSGGHHLSYREQNKSLNKEMAREDRQTKRQKVSGSGDRMHPEFKKRLKNIDVERKKRQRENE